MTLNGVVAGLRTANPALLWAFMMRATAAALSYFIFAVIGRNSSLSAYTEFALIFTIAGFCGPLATLGQQTVAFKYLSPLFERSDPRLRSVIKHNLRILAFGLVLFGGIALVFMRRSVADASPLLLGMVAATVTASGVAEYLFAVQRAGGAVLASIFAKEVLWRVVFIALIAATLSAGRPLSTPSLALCFLLANGATVAAFVRGVWLRLRGIPSTETKSPPPAPAAQSMSFFGLTLLNSSLIHVDTLILGLMALTPDLAAYFSAQRTIQILTFFSYSVGMIAAPTISVALHNGQTDEVTRLSRRMSRQAGTCALIAGIVLAFFAGDALAIFKPVFREHADILRILCIGPVVYTLGGLHAWIPLFSGLETEYLLWRIGVVILFGIAKVAVGLYGDVTLFAWVSTGEMCAVTAVGVLLTRRRHRIWAI